MATKKRVAIVGGGVSGLVSIKSCLEEGGLEPVCFERHDKLGGVWYYTKDLRPGQGGAIYDSVVSNNSKEYLAFSDFPFPKEYPQFVGRRLLFKYLQDYAAHFDLEKYIRFNTDVISVKPSGRDKYWTVQLQHGNDSVTTEEFDYVMVCTSIFNKAHTPSYPGIDNFAGMKIHTNEYREPDRFRGKTVLVIGGSVSGGEISSEVARNASKVYLSMRHGTWFIPRTGKDGLSYEFHMTMSVMKSPLKMAKTMEKISKTRVVDHQVFGLQGKDLYSPLKSIMVNDDMQDRLTQGQIKPVVDIKEFLRNDVILVDGTALKNIDAVIFATGYKFSVPILDDSILYDESDNAELYKYIFPIRLEHPERLALINIVYTFEANWPVAELHARLASRVFAGKMSLPEQTIIQRDVEHNVKNVKNKYFHVPGQTHMDEIAEILGVKPSFWRLLVSDPKLAIAYEYGPMVPYWYRLQGPGAWPGARDRILNAVENSIFSLKGYPSLETQN
ncbi:dimethylaniline monooxygenase [N-oxide-forming] 2-like [Ptychodera flava]|uniref:dimethylaniline monooxygenase [N-oxide-forming] 2-like n=1 Tax=Ptychodera flava TaxID=63121 RepID=UPI00396A6BF8